MLMLQSNGDYVFCAFSQCSNVNKASIAFPRKYDGNTLAKQKLINDRSFQSVTHLTFVTPSDGSNSHNGG